MNTERRTNILFLDPKEIEVGLSAERDLFTKVYNNRTSLLKLRVDIHRKKKTKFITSFIRNWIKYDSLEQRFPNFQPGVPLNRIFLLKSRLNSFMQQET